MGNDFEPVFRERVHKALVSHGCVHIWDDIHDALNESEDTTQAFTSALLCRLKESSADAAAILTDCACHASHDDLDALRTLWRQTQDLALVHTKLQEQFIRFIRDYKKLDDNQIGYLIKNGWGMAGILEGASVTATKIPAMYHEYFATDDPVEKRYHYCHCPRVKESLRQGIAPDPLYCHCGLGYYLDIWRYILDRPVKGTIHASILKGDDVCRFRLDLS